MLLNWRMKMVVLTSVHSMKFLEKSSTANSRLYLWLDTAITSCSAKEAYNVLESENEHGHFGEHVQYDISREELFSLFMTLFVVRHGIKYVAQIG